MTWDEHVDNIIKKINQRIGIIYRIKHLIPLSTRMVLYNSLILPLLDYGDLIWADKNNSTLMEHLQILQNKTAKIMLDYLQEVQPPRCLQMKPLLDRCFFHHCYMYMVYKGLNKLMFKRKGNWTVTKNLEVIPERASIAYRYTRYWLAALTASPIVFPGLL